MLTCLLRAALTLTSSSVSGVNLQRVLVEREKRGSLTSPLLRFVRVAVSYLVVRTQPT